MHTQNTLHLLLLHRLQGVNERLALYPAKSLITGLRQCFFCESKHLSHILRSSKTHPQALTQTCNNKRSARRPSDNFICLIQNGQDGCKRGRKREWEGRDKNEKETNANVGRFPLSWMRRFHRASLHTNTVISAQQCGGWSEKEQKKKEQNHERKSFVHSGEMWREVVTSWQVKLQVNKSWEDAINRRAAIRRDDLTVLDYTSDTHTYINRNAHIHKRWHHAEIILFSYRDERQSWGRVHQN